MSYNSSLIDHEQILDERVHSLTQIGKTIDSNKLIILYANSLWVNIFDNWTQSQMAFIDMMTNTEFKEYIHKEEHCLNTYSLSQSLSIEKDPDIVQANMAKIQIFFLRKQKII